MKERFILPVYALTLLLSAFLIFSVQPLFSKMVLPLLGGSSSVWNTAMVFFQALLLAGYGYAHLLTAHCKPKMQIIVHIFLLLLFTIYLPLSVGSNPQPSTEQPTLWQLQLMLAAIGGPFFILSASAPLLQKWFSASHHQRSANPYFLYAISNVGSMGSLLAYPLLIEPLSTLTTQRNFWSIGYVVLILLTACSAVSFWNSSAVIKGEINLPVAPKLLNKFGWIGYALIPSSLLLGFTTLITTDLASVPLFWVVPLVIYLITFILAFSEREYISVSTLNKLTLYSICFTTLLFIGALELPKLGMIAAYLFIFFVMAQYCHSKLARLQPNPAFLTNYYLCISLGGVLGGIFNALLAPNLFVIPAELSIPIIAIAFTFIDRESWMSFSASSRISKINMILMAPILCGSALIVGERSFQLIISFLVLFFLIYCFKKYVMFAWTVMIALILFPPVGWNVTHNIIKRERNYFGILTVKDEPAIRTFFHGVTLHGAQPKEERLKLLPITYYHPAGPAGDIFRALSDRPTPQEVAVLGLGVGSVACYAASGRSFDFYEIDPDVIEIAQDPLFFTYLKDCGSPYRTILGDARLKILDAQDGRYDLIFIDTFSSDNIPVHVMTKEAFQAYFRKVKEDGIVAMHISNRYLDLRPVLLAIAKELGMEARVKIDRKDFDVGAGIPYYKSMYVVFSKSAQRLEKFTPYLQWLRYEGKLPATWTDDYANILGAFDSVD